MQIDTCQHDREVRRRISVHISHRPGRMFLLR
jgi:hypothetical protein